MDEKDTDRIDQDAQRPVKGCCKCCHREPRGKLHSFNWLNDIPGGYADSDMVEVQFKNTRKGFYKNSTNLPLEIGDIVAVEASPGHDIGQVTLVGALVNLRMRKARLKADAEVKRVFRKAKPADLEKFEEARAKEHETMIKARKIAESLNLNMKIGDVEYQGDGNKAIFYYIADERVDFRKLIRILADTFKIRVEMKQIGARQEAGRIGGIGPCGRPLCCASWLSNFVSVGTSAARFQDISMNPQKLAGQCGKLKCCLNYEVDNYIEAARKFPPKDAVLLTADGEFYQFKTDILKGEITYSTDKSVPANLVTISTKRAFEVIALNKQGVKPEALSLAKDGEGKADAGFVNMIGQDSLTRFDKSKRKKKKKTKGNPADKPGDKPKQQRQTEGEAKADASQGKEADDRRQRNRQKPQRKNNPQRPALPRQQSEGGKSNDETPKRQEQRGQKPKKHPKPHPKPQADSQSAKSE